MPITHYFTMCYNILAPILTYTPKSLHRIMSDVAMLLMTDAKLMSFYFRKLRSPFTPFFTMSEPFFLAFFLPSPAIFLVAVVPTTEFFM